MPLHAKQIRDHFRVTSHATPWFEVDGKPLQWYVRRAIAGSVS
jgi:hypothetical protein